MKDYKLSEIKAICNENHNCRFCPMWELCYKLIDTVEFYSLDIEEE